MQGGLHQLTQSNTITVYYTTQWPHWLFRAFCEVDYETLAHAIQPTLALHAVINGFHASYQ